MKNIIGAIFCALISHPIAIYDMFTHDRSLLDLSGIDVEDKYFPVVLLVAQTVIIWAYFFYILALRKRNAKRLQYEENRQQLF